MSADSHPVPSGESALEERLRAAALAAGAGSTHWQGCEVEHKWCAVLVMLDDRARLTAEVARLTADLAEARDDLRRECEASEHHRAEAARYREALYRIACGAMPWTREEMIDHAVAALTTEGGDCAAR